MRLVSLEIKGFKSFPEKTTIHFNDSVTGVVGPNGCGKSNIVDAIRWVLGEQKTTMLRSEKMENIIFNGTKQRKASSLAEVALTFENDRNLLPTEFHTVTISRHYFRNGDSEYKLNGITCRLKDITSLFLDTGISSDSYAIIELGMVDEILNDKEHSRRKLFEQAAGISKYKARKKETLHKLEATQDDLNRVDDLLFEIETNLKALESQARKTERYYKLKEEYRNLSIELALYTLKGFRESFTSLQQQQQAEEDRKVQLTTEVAALEAVLEQEKARNIEKEKDMIAKQKELNDFISSIKQKEHEKHILSENLKFQIDRRQQLAEQVARSTSEVEMIASEIASFSSRRLAENQALQTLTHELESARLHLEGVRFEHADVRSRLEQQNGLLREAERELAEIEKSNTIRQVQRENLEQEATQRRHESSAREQELVSLHDQRNVLASEEAHKKQIILELTRAGDELQTRINAIQEEMDSTREELRSIHRHLDARQNEFNLTRSFIDNMEGFPDSIKFLKQHPEWATHAPLLSDVISCPAEFRIAIENYLEPYLNYYIVADMQEAFSAVNLLSHASKGRANFFVLNDFEENASAHIPVPDHLVAALDVVETDIKYRALTSHLLKNVFLQKDDAFLTLPFGEAVVIARSGKFIRSRWALSGGQVGSFSGKRLGRIKNLESLEQEIRQQQDNAGRIQNRIQSLQDELIGLRKSSQDERLEEAREEHLQVKNQISSVQARIEQTEQLVTNHQNRIRQIGELLENLSEELAQIQNQSVLVSDKKNGFEKLVFELGYSFTAAETKLNQASDSFNKQHIDFLQHKSQLAATERELEYKSQQQEAARQSIETNSTELAQAESNITALEAKLRLAESSIVEAYTRQTGFEKTAAAAEQTYYESRGKIDEVDDQIRSLGKNKAQVEHLLQQIHDRITELKIGLNSLKDRLHIEFKVEVETLMEREPDETLHPEEVRQKSERLKNRIETYGEINPMAMEAFQEMKQRHDFIMNQKNDLLSARTSLLQTIEEIENTAKQKFMEAYLAVKENFQAVFKGLFTPDDECDLVLENPDDILESKIQIIAKPKGKRPQIIDQLSGGEKTLTAISLLFALYMYKPAPFCVLDEVDAPLDDANIEKFNHIVRDFSQKSQFILVTHNKQTMTSVDAIYGITMQEEGVSKVVPVDFRSLN